MTRAIFAWGLACTVWSVSAPVHACDPLPPSTPVVVAPDQTDVHWAAGYAAVGAANVALIALEVALAEEVFPVWLGAIELVLGVTQSVVAAVLAGSSISLGAGSCSSPWQHHGVIASSLLVVGGGWLITHGIVSIAVGSARPVEVAPVVALGADGGSVGIHGTF